MIIGKKKKKLKLKKKILTINIITFKAKFQMLSFDNDIEMIKKKKIKKK